MTSLLTSLTSYRFWRLAEGWYSKNSCQKVAHSRACMNKTSHYYIFLWNIFLYRYTRSNQCNPIHVSQSPTTFKHPLTHDNRIAAPYQSYSPAEIVRGQFHGFMNFFIYFKGSALYRSHGPSYLINLPGELTLEEAEGTLVASKELLEAMAQDGDWTFQSEQGEVNFGCASWSVAGTKWLLYLCNWKQLL